MLIDVKTPPQKNLSPLEVLSNDLSKDMACVNREILTRMTSDVPLINKIARHLIQAGGKRLRPLLTLSISNALGGNMSRAHGLAATVEFIHTATLLHDDVVDESHERRGKAAANDVYGNQASVLVGDFLFSRSFQLMVADGSLETLKILSDASAIIAEGEVMQLQMQRNLETGWDDYIQMIGAKTAALFAAACEVGAVVSQGESEIQNAARDFGYYLGLAFQIADDVLDYSAEQGQLGKAIGDDFREGKISAPVLLAYVASSDDEKDFWVRTITDGQQSETDFATAQNILKTYHISEQGLDMARTYADKALAALDTLPDSRTKHTLAQICEYVVTRNF